MTREARLGVMMLYNAKNRAIAAQVAGVAVFAVLLGAGGVLGWARLKAQGVAYGFGVLLAPTGWTINSPMLGQAAIDPYWWTILVALANTALVAIVSIASATVVGFAIGVGRLSANRVTASICAIYVETFRNIPLVLQVVFWYATFTNLPNPRADPPSLWGLVYLTNKGVFLPGLAIGHQADAWLLLPASIIAGAVWLPKIAKQKIPGIPFQLFAWSVALVSLLLVLVLRRTIVFNPPVLLGFSFTAGAVVPLEIIALTFSIVVFSSAYIAEIVRGGLQSVPKGQIEAAMSLGLRPWPVFVEVRLPIALRSMIPPLSNQFIFIIKSTALGIAVGFSDLFAVSIGSISHTGQTIEFLLVMMAAYVILNYSTTLLMGQFNRAIAFKGQRS